MSSKRKTVLELLTEKGVEIPNPSSVDIGDEIDPDNISPDGVVIYTGCKIYGEKTIIMSDAKLGYEGPTTIVDCQLGPGVKLKGGYFEESTFLDKANMGYGAQVRKGCLLEEEANGAHNVGLKQTILFPFVTLGSLINFCDCLMAGGTSRKNHSEVGSSYIHFNYTPNQDKATASLIGDAPKGVMLNQRPIFLGGQGGLVGPSCIGYGTLIPAGIVYRGDCLEEGKLLVGTPLEEKQLDFHTGVYWNIERRILNSVEYIANSMALRQWYLSIRFLFCEGDPMRKALYGGAVEKIDVIIAERIKRLKDLVQKLPDSIEGYTKVKGKKPPQKLLEQKRELHEQWDKIEASLKDSSEKKGPKDLREEFIATVKESLKNQGPDYIEVTRGLPEEASNKGTMWLQRLVDEIKEEVLDHLPSFK